MADPRKTIGLLAAAAAALAAVVWLMLAGRAPPSAPPPPSEAAPAPVVRAVSAPAAEDLWPLEPAPEVPALSDELPIAAAVPPGEPAVRGVVRDEAGAPIPGARVVVLPRGADWRRYREKVHATDEAGRFSAAPAENDPDGLRLVVDAVDQGYILDETLLPADAADRRAEMKVVLPRGRVIAGRLTGPEGVPIGGATVHLIEAGRIDKTARRPSEGRVETDEDGRFRDDALRPGIYRLRASGTFGDESFFVSRLVEAGHEDVRLEFAGFGSLSIRLSDEKTGQALVAEYVEARWIEQVGPEGEEWIRWAKAAGESPSFPALPAGAWRLAMRVAGRPETVTDVLSVRAGEHLGPLRFRIP